MLSQRIIDQLQPHDFDRLARKEPDGRWRLRLIALAHLKDGKRSLEVAAAVRVTRHAVMRWVQWSPGAMRSPLQIVHAKAMNQHQNLACGMRQTLSQS